MKKLGKHAATAAMFTAGTLLVLAITSWAASKNATVAKAFPKAG